MSNYPPGAENDPNAPWNQDDSYNDRVEEAASQVRGFLADELPMMVMQLIRDEIGGDEDFQDHVYDEVMERVRLVWENI